MKKLFALLALLSLLLIGIALAPLPPGALLGLAIQPSFTGRLSRLYIRMSPRHDWNRPMEYGELALNSLMASCQPWHGECAETAELLLSQGANINGLAINKLGFAPLHAALASKEAVEFLLQHGADPQQKAGGERFLGLTPLALAQQFKEPPVESMRLLELHQRHQNKGQ